jgi:hypothetical protein
MRRALRLIVLAAAALLLASCSFTRLAYMNAALAYTNATPVLAWMVGDYVELSGAQKDWVRERLGRGFAWHRAEQLPEYRRFFETVLKQAEDTISVEEARAGYREVRTLYHRLLERMAPDIADFLLQLDAEQVAQMERKFGDDNRKVAREAAQGSPEARRERRLKRYLDHIEEWTGRLSGPQHGLVAERVAAMEDPVEERVADRRYRQGEILSLVRNKPPREQAIAALKRLLVDTESWRQPRYLQKLRERDEKLFAMIAALSQTLTPEQRDHFQKRVRGFMRDITELTASSN